VQLQPNGIGDKAAAEPLRGRYAFDIHLSAAAIAKVRFGSNPAVQGIRPGYRCLGLKDDVQSVSLPWLRTPERIAGLPSGA